MRALLRNNLRFYQLEAIGATIKAILEGERSGLWIMPTGTGKTRMFCSLAILLDLPTLVLVHRDELIKQTKETLFSLSPMTSVGVVKADRNEWDKDIVIASVQSLNVKRLAEIPSDRFALVIPDECHHAAAPSWGRAIRYFDQAFLLGVTATPDRLDGKGLAEWFGKEPLYHYSLIQAIRDKYLVPICQQAVESEVCLDEVHTRGNDFVNHDLANTVNRPERNRAIVEAFKEHAIGRRAVAFGADLAHCYDLALLFNESGVMAAVIDGNMELDERRELLARFTAGRFQVLVNCEVLTEGFDDPDVDCIVMARPTKSRALFTQCVGRGLRLPRLNKSKKDCLVLDVTDNCRSHKLMTACSLLGSKQQNAEGKNVLELVDREEREERERNERIVEDIRGPVRWRLESVCPWPGLPTLDGYKPTASWHDQPASEKQEKMVRGFGLEVQARLTKGEASWLIDKCLAYEAAYPTPATAAQEWRLRYMGAWEEGMTKKEASRRIGQLMKQESSNEAAT